MSRICHACIDERVLKAEVRATGERARCDWCGRTRKGFTAERLAARVRPVYETIIGPAEEGFRPVGGRAGWGPLGRPASQLMTELIGADDERIGAELIGVLAAGNRFHAHDGGLDYYDEQSEDLDFFDPADTRLRDGWVDFRDRLRHGSRFFASPEALDAILGPLLAGPYAEAAIRRIAPGDPLSTLYRGRQADDEAAQREIYARPLARLAASPQGRSGPGRMNAAGISVFYAAADVDTCLAELRIPVGGAAVVGRFEIIRPVRLLDLSRLDTLGTALSRFEENYVEKLSYQSFIRSFHDELKRAVLPGRETLDYLPTQAVAEYLWTRPEPLDGIIFGSSQISGPHLNVALFPHACLIDGAEEDPVREVLQVWTDGPQEEGDDRPVVSRVIIRPLPAQADPAAPLPTAYDDEDWFGGDLGPGAAAAPAATLRPAENFLQIARVHAIRLESDAMPVRIEEHRDWRDI